MVTMSLAPATLPLGQRVYAIGDVHGCAARLGVLHVQIAEDLAVRPVDEPTLVHLGDYIDRGEDSAGVLDWLGACWRGTPSPRAVNLRGNHEAMLLAALDGGEPSSVLHWLANGGAASLASWGVSQHSPRAEWRRRIPPDHLALIRALAPFHRQGGYVLRPGVPMERQTIEDMLWIREPFLSFVGDLPGVVVHGHTPERTPTIRPNRIGVDTGAVMGGMLTCAVLEADRVGFLHA
jgi:serine/threonine protein phosphatase 1